MDTLHHSGDTPLHELNAFTKLVAAGSLTAAGVVSPLPGTVAVVATLLTASVVGGVLRRVLKMVLTVTTPVGVSLFVMHGLFYPGNDVAVWKSSAVTVSGHVVSVTIWKEGLLYALDIVTQVVVIVLATVLLVTTTPPRRMATALEERGLPRSFSYAFLASFAFISDLRSQADAILDAQQSRGLDVEANVLRRFRAFLDLMSPLFIGSIVSAQTRSLALKARGFDQATQVTHIDQTTMTATDRAITFVSVGVLLLAIGARLTTMVS